jgi:hypothetical protein
MKSIISGLLSLGFACVLALGLLPSKVVAAEMQLAQVQQPPKMQLKEGEEITPVAAAPGVAPAAAVSACALCYTCGGSWPIYSGTIGKLTPAPSYTPMEFDSGCSGSLQYRGDDHPYLCCRGF